jgi:tetrahydromethanopterin S-methyltransferase subunit C
MGPTAHGSTTLTPEEAIIVASLLCRPANIATADTLRHAAGLFLGHLQPRASAG